MKLYIVTLLVALAGCSSYRPAFVVEMNGRRLEFEKFLRGTVPNGVQVSHFDGQTMQVIGDLPIEVNGMTVLAQGDELIIADQKFRVHRDAEVVVREDGEVQIRLSLKLHALPAAPVTPAEK